MGIVLSLALLVLGVAHAALVVGLAVRRWWGAALLALLLPPLAPWSGWRCGMRGRAIAWLAAFVSYALGAALVRL
jgi:hypothetical protein